MSGRSARLVEKRHMTRDDEARWSAIWTDSQGMLRPAHNRPNIVQIGTRRCHSPHDMPCATSAASQSSLLFVRCNRGIARPAPTAPPSSTTLSSCQPASRSVPLEHRNRLPACATFLRRWPSHSLA
ncbi:hypothetical protein LshimejAT787_0305000 [Lyophyllum shimeji]|uniref:Uncharacterized protein n=1 Tax=Lyophyllum shimeji TaxID=47721 RepID=A0A9P3PIZ6_LYOSH|nr:hypothetical protein LshimejAT787_0305000 [Lyophyllum shimeji]